MATTNDSAVVDLGRLKTFKNKLDASVGASSVNAATSPRPGENNYKPATSNGDGSCAMGNQSQAMAAASVAIGKNSNAKAETAIAIGFSAAATELNSVALGRESKANGRNSVALGDSSLATGPNEVSIGNVSKTRRISHVSNPTYDTDAATKSYVDNFITQIIEIGSVTSTLTNDQLNELSNNWPNVVLVTANTDTAYLPGSRVTNNQGIDIFTLYAIDSTVSNIVKVGTDRKINLVIQIDIESENGTISFAENYLAFPAIATNPRLTDNVSVLAAGTDSIAAGNGAVASGLGSVAVGNSAKAYDSNTVAVGNNATASNPLSIALGLNSNVSYASSIAIGPNTKASNTSSIAFGASSKTDRNHQVSVGDKASGITRYLSNVKDPVEDQDAATRYWVKNADRSDAIPTSLYSGTYGGSGSFKLEENKDMKWISVRGYTSWATFNEVWQKMVNLPNSTDGWWIKTDMKLLAGMTPTTNLFSPCYGLGFYSTYTMPQRTFVVSLAVGIDGYIYIGSWYNNSTWSSEPYGIYLSGQRFYL